MRRVCRRTSSSQAEPSPWRHCWTSWASCSKLPLAPFSRFLHSRKPQVISLGLPYSGTQIASEMFPDDRAWTHRIAASYHSHHPERLCDSIAYAHLTPPSCPQYSHPHGAKSRKWWLLGLGGLLLGFLLYHSRHLLNFSEFSGAKALARHPRRKLHVSTDFGRAIYLCYAVRALRWQRFQAHVARLASGIFTP